MGTGGRVEVRRALEFRLESLPFRVRVRRGREVLDSMPKAAWEILTIMSRHPRR